jgi:acetolactate synthase small subunit
MKEENKNITGSKVNQKMMNRKSNQARLRGVDIKKNRQEEQERAQERIEMIENKKEEIKKKRTRGRNKLSNLSRQTLIHALDGHSFKIKMALDQIFAEDPKLYIDAISKLLNYTIPKLSATEITDNTIRKVEIILDKDATIDDLKKQLEDIESEE